MKERSKCKVEEDKMARFNVRAWMERDQLRKSFRL